ncbi:MAG: sensor histidine kinase [Magnetovibrionaceae bacterium]
MYPLVSRFAVFALVAMILSLATISYSFWDFSIRRLTEATEANNKQLAQVLSNALPQQITEYVLAAKASSPDVQLLREGAPTIDAPLLQLIQGLPILKIKLYAPNGLTVYSSNLNDIGSSKAKSAVFQAVIRSGVEYSNTSFRDHFQSFEGPVAERWLIETYLPIKLGDGTISWVFELYSDVTKERAQIFDHTVQLVGSVTVVFVLLYICLVAFSKGCSKVMAHQYEELSQARKSAEIANRSKSEFLATMSHELRTPLTSALGGLKLIDGLHADKLPEEVKKLVDLAIRNNESLLRLVNELLDFEKVLSGRFSVICQPHDIAAITARVVSENKGYALTQGVSFDLIPPDRPCWAKVDEHRLEQVLNNLLSNAAKFSHEGGHVLVEVSNLRERVQVQVKDKGIGIPERLQKAIFEPFTQVEDVTTRRHKGTGLGLPICKFLVEAMDGEIQMESVEGLGSNFRIVFPRIDEIPSAKVA